MIVDATKGRTGEFTGSYAINPVTDERIPVCIPLQGCYPVWSIDIARIEVCFRAPSELCARLCVGKWGLEKCWDACAHVPFAAEPARVPTSDPVCGCSA